MGFAGGFAERFTRKRAVGPKHINLALQGGGAHGAFTWGVLDRLMQSHSLVIDAISGTSAGAVNAVAMAAGFLDGGRDGARDKLSTVWQAINDTHCLSPLDKSLPLGPGWSERASNRPIHVFLRALIGSFSPYEFNPLEIDPLRRLLATHIDFDALGRHSPIALYINATDASTGRGRIFNGEDVTLDALLASTCLPAFRHAVQIGDNHYWDGAFSANPPLLPLIDGSDTPDTLIVRLAAGRCPDVPKRAADIQGNVNRLVFSMPLRHEIQLIEMAKRSGGADLTLSDTYARKLRRHHFHVIDGADHIAQLSPGSALTPSLTVLNHLFESGRSAANSWLRRHRKAVGEHSTVDLERTFL